MGCEHRGTCVGQRSQYVAERSLTTSSSSFPDVKDLVKGAGAAVGIFLGVLIVIIIIWLVFRKKEKKKYEEEETPNEIR